MLDAKLIQAFIISLPSARMRRTNINSCLNGQVAFEIVDAVSGNELMGRDQEYCPQRYCPRYFRDLTLNEIACSLSHRKALRRFLETDAKYGLILEDDAHIDRQNFRKLYDVITGFGDFDILKLGGSGKYVSRGVVQKDCNGTVVVAALTFGLGAHGYVVSRSAAEKIAGTIVPIKDAYDSFLRNVYVHKCNIFETSPWLVNLQKETFNSTIGDGRSMNKRGTTLRHNLAGMAFRLKYNTMKRVFNLRRFGVSYITKSGFTNNIPSGM
jgi:glycosyl transferase, family 25